MGKEFLQFILCLAFFCTLSEFGAEAKCRQRCLLDYPETCPDGFECKNASDSIPRCHKRKVGCFTTFGTTECRDPIKGEYEYFGGYYYDYSNVEVIDGDTACYCNNGCASSIDCCYDAACLND